MRLIILCIFFFYTWHLDAPDQANDLLAVDMPLDSHTLSVNCTFLCSFQRVWYCEIKLSYRPYLHPPGDQRTISRESWCWCKCDNNITLKASTVYLCNVSAVLEDDSPPPVVVVQGVITTPSTSELCTWLTLNYLLYILALEPLSNGLMTKVEFLGLIPKMCKDHSSN